MQIVHHGFELQIWHYCLAIFSSLGYYQVCQTMQYNWITHQMKLSFIVDL